jgi:hypothetical protein
MEEPEKERQSPTGEPFDISIASNRTIFLAPLFVTVKSHSLLVLLMPLVGALKVSAAAL